MAVNTLYRITYLNDESVYEIYAKQIAESNMFGFVEVSEMVFGETSQVVVDPSEERLKLEFQGVKRTYIPAQSIIRIDEVEKEGASKIKEFGNKRTLSVASNIRPFMPSDK